MWSFEGSLPDGVMYRMEVDKYGLNPEIYPEINDILEVKAGINWIISAATTGYTEKLSDIKNVTSPSGRGNVKLRKIRSFPSANFSYSISQIERITYDFVSSSYVQLQYGNRVKDIWDRYRTTVETALQQLGFANHLSIIQDNIGKDNPEAWRAAVFECRSMLNDLADYLWKDPRDTYDLLKGSGSNGKLEVKQNNFGNRLSAYLHQKSVNGDEGKFLRDEAGKLSDSIENLIKLQNKGHKSIERPLADMVVLSTYFIIGEIAIRTDLMPIMEYSATQQI